MLSVRMHSGINIENCTAPHQLLSIECAELQHVAHVHAYAHAHAHAHVHVHVACACARAWSMHM